MNKKKIISRITVFLIILSMLVLSNTSNFYSYAQENNFTSNVMAPLHVDDWNQFEYELAMAKDMGVDAVSVDVWWGDVEEYDNQFDWNYYDCVFKKIKEAGLKIVPIMSFHQCGGNVGDSYNSYLPSWVWDKYNGKIYMKRTLKYDDLKYKSELGNTSAEYLSLWVDDLVSNEYIDFMNAFEEYFKGYKDDFAEINISCGPAGELRYPSYNAHDNNNFYSGFPNKGYLQCYSDLAQEDFRKCMLEKYKNLQGVNKAWGLNLNNIMEITPPMDGGNFFYGEGKAYLNSSYGKDFIEWYNKRLVNHGRNMITYALKSFDDELSDVQLGIKIPGIHWQINNGNYPRTAEINAGIINTNFSEQNGYGYNPIMQMIKDFNGKVILHFTCLEMNDGNGGEYTSAAKTLVGWVGDTANDNGVEIKGENALNVGNDDKQFWDNIKDGVDNHHYNGITILRMNDVVYGDSNKYYHELINSKKVKSNNEGSITFRVNNANTNFGEEIYVVGNQPQLGNWDPNKAVKLYTYNYPSWTVTVEGFEKGSEVEFKFIKKSENGVTWENIENNRKYNVNSGVGEYIVDWNDKR
ncbi:family 14 glycosylhydrolase [Tepidibacter formicigenes]|jgi:hypothetical protein|uniref:Beta-amylase n=1 Tax=Tepidibacter formicigenes DSM 15518 TaxID=1123349 RepID=A0A1M6KUG9_9FIRM|nr:family 14 glycosylhydrolase [Tepidibacter formicigenes]SHJ62583.1 Starch binding domain-containing protein [Tepidibacter formicigenes DSM 15518]